MIPKLGPVIVVDDDAAVRHALKFALEIEGFPVRLYDGPKQLLADADLPTSGCLILDYRMPEMNGLDLLDCLRQRRIDMPAILMTGQLSPECESAVKHDPSRYSA
ncbi:MULTISPECIES: response regulator transcription factor [Methylorubrum]|uniref:Response regulatory domain-containing protein n=1 Tax=Methylorubrum extorquens (strain ATCC 14718 / DSM 1338 / JCM 2805 / NCIMB 9133 / AM1) TaxID=272630 RepID=C5B1N9_METEA|nr:MULTISPECIES: response regulator [Methylorubrum]MBY0144050.1 response regulator [Methylorubrum populi]ACS39673.1 Hypothetical protein MexAM1_META1p1831 [Methylorubrum extorquens AM1]MBK3403947.1 response regulator [Methylorubrum rhodesianum]MCP1542205.1 FixJ family two-component response regulator [Methylorubrum extorquens]MCP1590450.1 FixJ family two-component response regulator [Methylorubrum extorquens]